MNKMFCDACEAEISQGTMAGSFDKIEPTYKKDNPFMMKHWDLCKDCAIDVKQKVVELQNPPKEK